MKPAVKFDLSQELRTRLQQMELIIQAAAAARVVADEHRVSPDDVEEYIAAETERLRTRDAHEMALVAWHDETRAILLAEDRPS